jgi:hypothetical protein
MAFKSIRTIYDKKHEMLALSEQWASVLGDVEANGLWLICGEEKMGKTTCSILLAEELRKIKRVGYVMAEQGFDADFKALLKRLGVKVDTRLKFSEYTPIDELDYTIKKKNQPEVIFLDNLTSYADELKGGRLMKLINKNPNKLFICIAHIEDNKLVGSVARTARRFAKRIIMVEGNMAMVEGRSQGGQFIIDQEKAQLYHGTI